MTAKSLLARKVRRDLRRQRSQVLAVMVTVLVGVAVFILTAGMSSNLRDSYDLTYDRTNLADVWASGASEGTAQAIEALSGVNSVEERLSAEVAATFDRRPIVTRLIGFESDWQINQLVLTNGEWTSDGVVLEEHTAEHFGLSSGDEIEIDGLGVMEVSGVAVSPEYLWVARNAQDRIVDPDDFGVVFASWDTVSPLIAGSTQLVVDVADPDAVAGVVQLGLASGASEAVTRDDHPSYQTLEADLEGFSQLSIMFPVLFLLAAALATVVLLSRLIAQQTAEIGMMRANGFSDRTIQLHYTRYGLTIALVGAALAVPLGVLGGWMATSGYTSFLGIPFTSRQLHPLNWGLGLLFAIVTGSVAGLFPARAATRTEPAAAMRPGGGAVKGGRSIVERFLPSGIPNWLRVAIRNLGRQPKRVASTAVGIVLSLVLTMTAMVLNDSINEVFDAQYNRIDLRGLVVATEGPTGEVFSAISSVGGVSTTEYHTEVGAAVVGPDGAATQRLLVFQPATSLHGFTDLAEMPPDGVLLSTIVADQIGAEPGDSVQIRTEGEVGGLVVVRGLIDEPLAGSAYLSTVEWERLGGPPITTVGVGLADRSAHREVRDEILEIDGVTQVSDRVAISARIESLLAASQFFVAIILALAVLMAVALVFNAMSITIAERETEVATLAANGVGRGWIRKAITAETMTTVVLAMIPGLTIGRLTAGFFVSQFSTDQFRFDPVLNLASVVAAVFILSVCAIVAQIPGLRRLDRLDLSVKVRERAL